MKRIHILTILFCFCMSACCQNILLNALERESVTKIAKTPSGTMLLGTDNGLMTYNGITARQFITDDCMRPYNFVNDILQLDANTILVGMRNGLYVANASDMACKHIYSMLTDVTSVISNNTDSLYASCKNGLAIIPANLKGKARIVPVDQTNISSPSNQILCAAIDEQTIWMGNGENTLISYNINEHKIKEHAIDASMLSSGITSIAVIKPFTYIATLNNGLLRYNPESQHTEAIAGVWPSVKEIKNYGNTLYICTDGDGAYTLHEGQLQRLNTTNNSVYSCHHDHVLNLNWFGYYQNGMSSASNAKPLFKTYKYKSFDSAGIFVRSFCKRGKEMLIGSLDGLYYINEAKGVVRHFNRQEMGCAIITDIKHFADKFIVASYEHGLLSFDTRTMEMKPLLPHSKYTETSCSRLVVTPDSSCLYVGSSAGILCLDRHLAVKEHYDNRHSDILGNFIYDMILDKSGKLWVSTAKGMRILNTKTKRFQNTGYPKGFCNEVPNLTFNFSYDGDILSASETSLLRSKADLSSTVEHHIMQRCGLRQIDFILPCGNQYITGTDRGLFIFDRHFRTFSQYSEADGLPSSRFTRFAAFTDDDGNIWMANKAGLVCISKHNLMSLSNNQKAKVFVDQYAIERSGHAMEIVQTADSSICVWWNFGSDHIIITPHLLDYSPYPSKRYYIWNLDGQSDSIAFEQQDIRLSKLSLGSHKLTIHLAGHPETATTLTIHVMPSAIFYIEMLVILLLIIIALMLLRMNKRKRERAKLIRQKHAIELQLASANAVNLHKQQEKDRKAKEELQKQQDKEIQLKNRANDYKQMYAIIENHMQKDRPYLRDNLRLSQLATVAGTNATTLSQMFNDYLHTSFFDYINRYRVEEFKKRATMPQNSQLTLLAISEQCGFKRSSFFSVFKKMEGCTPSEWVKKQENVQ